LLIHGEAKWASHLTASHGSSSAVSRGGETYQVYPVVSLYADDSCFVLNPQSGSLLSFIENIENYSILSGLQQNYDKYHITYWIVKKHNFYITV
jgi:hypothetical protein